MPQAKSVILLADESRFFLTIERQFLRNVPVEIVEAQSAEQALATCRANPPDLIYLAYDLPDQDGAACCRAFKSERNLSSIPLILVCDSARPEQETICRDAGCDGLLVKPLDRHRFLEVGRRFLAGIRERRRSCLITIRGTSPLHSVEGRGLDISTGGVFLDTTAKIPLGTELKFELKLSRPHEPGPTVNCTGFIAWANTRENPIKPHHPVGYGVRFSDVPGRDLAVLTGYLNSLDNR